MTTDDVHYVQVQNPKTKCWVLVNVESGTLIDSSDDDMPFENVEIIGNNKKDETRRLKR